MGKRPGKTDNARVHLEVLGETREVSFSVRIDACTVTDMLPAAREVSRTVTAAAIAKAEAAGLEVSCRRGCTACCRHLIPISVVEAAALAERVAAMPADRRAAVRARFAAAVQRMEDGGLLDSEEPRGNRALRSAEAAEGASWDDVSRRYFDMAIDCPLLEGQACSVYADRPLVCAEYHVTTPADWCEKLDRRTRAIDWPLRMSEVMAELAGEVVGVRPAMVPLAMALEWYDEHGGSLSASHAGEDLFWRLMDQIEAHGTTSENAEGANEGADRR
jgi:Fe-S-cluster containining protein